MAARRPSAMQRERMNRIDGPGDRLRASAESMNRTTVFALGTAMSPPQTPRSGHEPFCHAPEAPGSGGDERSAAAGRVPPLRLDARRVLVAIVGLRRGG